MYDFHFTPKSEEELTDLLTEGEGTYEVASAERGEKAGFVMIILNLKVWDKNGQQAFIKDYMKLDPNSNFCMRKIRHFCYSCGLKEEWDKGRFSASDCPGRGGKLFIKTQNERKVKDPVTGLEKTYPAKSVVNDYIIDTSDLNNAVSQLQQRRASQPVRDDLPPVDAYDNIPL